MEDAHRRHKEVPFGWALWIETLVKAVRRRRARRKLWSDPPRATPPGDLHHLAAPR